LSSTAVVLKLLQDKDELNTPSGLKMTGILLFQDAAIIPAMILLPFISQLSDVQLLPATINLLIAFGGVVLIFFVSKLILPRIFNSILSLRIPDLLTVTVFVFLFGVAIFAHKLGISLAMGAFIVGIAISDSDYAHQINTDIIPSKHIFNSVFFISIGMFVNSSFLLTHIPEVFVATLIIIIVKIAVILFLFMVSRNPLNSGIMTAFGLAHIGEFSFILLRIAQKHTIFSQDMHQILLSSAILSMFFIPFAMRIGKRLARIEKFKKKLPETVKIETAVNHTVIAGYGLNGKNISRILKLLNIPYTILEMNATTVRNFKSLGEPIHFGSIDRADNLNRVGIEKASLLVIAINDIESSERAVRLARQMNPTLRIIARVNYLTQVESFYNLGADLVLSQDMETSLIFIHHILKIYNMPEHISRIQTDLLRKEHYRFFLKKEAQNEWKLAIPDFIEQDSELFFIGAYSKHISKKLGDLDPFNTKDMKILGVVRENKIITESLKNLMVEKFDTILFCGNHKKVAEAISWMENNN
jgi:CPA2 family monovalent cation:H+ antiporter-2